MNYVKSFRGFSMSDIESQINQWVEMNKQSTPDNGRLVLGKKTKITQIVISREPDDKFPKIDALVTYEHY